MRYAAGEVGGLNVGMSMGLIPGVLRTAATRWLYRRVMPRLIAKPLRLFLAMMLVATGLAVAPASTAVACACGGIATDPGSNAKVYDEAAVIWTDGRSERIDMTLTMTGDPSSAAWLMPAPVGAKLSVGASGVMSRLDVAAAPKVITKKKYRLSVGFGEAGNQAVGQAPGGAQVESHVQIGPFDVTTLSGTSATGVNDWLKANGFGARDELLPMFQSYLDQDWRINAVKLVPEKAATLGRTLPPLRMAFPTRKVVYPMKLSGAATVAQQVRIHLLAARRMEIGTQAAPSRPLRLDFSGAIPASTAGLGRGLMPGHNDQVWLTSWSGTLPPRTITDDYDFKASATTSAYRRQITRTEYVDVPVLGIMLALIPVGLLIVLGLALLYTRQNKRL